MMCEKAACYQAAPKKIDVFLRITVEIAAVAFGSFAMTLLGVFFCIPPENPVRCSQGEKSKDRKICLSWLKLITRD